MSAVDEVGEHRVAVSFGLLCARHWRYACSTAGDDAEVLGLFKPLDNRHLLRQADARVLVVVVHVSAGDRLRDFRSGVFVTCL